MRLEFLMSEQPNHVSNFFGGVQFEKVNPHDGHPYGNGNALQLFRSAW
jgi:hypothetical protein